MPQIKIERILYRSSNDSEHVASNILCTDYSKKWKCQVAGEKEAILILKLEKPSRIYGIDIGNEHSAFIQVSVNRTNCATCLDDYIVLLPTCAFMTPMQSRQSKNAHRVKMFTYTDLNSSVRDEKWDQVKIVCSQPFNRRVQYGLSCVLFHSLDPNDQGDESALSKMEKIMLRAESPDNLSVDNLLPKRTNLINDASMSAAVVVIDAASNITAMVQDSLKRKSKLKDAPAAVEQGESSNQTRNQNELVNEDEEILNAQIEETCSLGNKERTEMHKFNKRKSSEAVADQTENKASQSSNGSCQNQSNTQDSIASTSTSNSVPDTDKNKRKANNVDAPQKKVKFNLVTRPFHQLLNGVTFVISRSIEYPDRTTILDEAIEMGARFKAEWDETCTHFIAPNLSSVKVKGRIVSHRWIRDCYRECKRYPWRRYALHALDQAQDESEDEVLGENPETKIRRGAIDAINELLNGRNRVNTDDAETDDEVNELCNSTNYQEVPDFFDERVFYIDKEFNGDDYSFLARYIMSYEGELVNEPSDRVEFCISASDSPDALQALCPRADIVGPDWVYACHRHQKLVSVDAYRL